MFSRTSFEGEITADALLAFEQKFAAGELKPSLKSEEPSEEDLKEPVKVVKGKSFKSMVLDTGKMILHDILEICRLTGFRFCRWTYL